jgi:hypothetical protein
VEGARQKFRTKCGRASNRGPRACRCTSSHIRNPRATLRVVP